MFDQKQNWDWLKDELNLETYCSRELNYEVVYQHYHNHMGSTCN